MASNTDLQQLLQRAHDLIDRLEHLLPTPAAAPDFAASIAFRWRRKNGAGLLQPVRQVASIALNDLQEVDGQKERLVRNTAQFVAGRPANNVLLTGARGTGKSSLIKACLNAFADQGLRLIGIDTASIDPADSHALHSHQVARTRQLRVLENLVLDAVPEGDYELIALPLKLMEAEASPVRAVLRALGPK